LLAPTVIALSRSNNAGLSCSLLVIYAWAFPNLEGAACFLGAAILWLTRDRIGTAGARIVRNASILFALIGLGWIFNNFLAAAWRNQPETNLVPGPLKASVGFQLLSIFIFAALAWWIRRTRPAITLPMAITLLLTVLAFRVPQALQDPAKDWDTAGNDDFSDWQQAIPPSANVFVAPAHNSAAFSWFTLDRPSYLTVDQSSGVVFSRATALEVRRRSQVLLPLMEPDWEILSSMARHDHGANSSKALLTKDRLIALCQDPELNFVVATENVGFAPRRHTRPGKWQNWNLYDCHRVQSAVL
jgi:hypothetical protein